LIVINAMFAVTVRWFVQLMQLTPTSDLRKRKENLMDEIVVENREAFKELAK